MKPRDFLAADIRPLLLVFLLALASVVPIHARDSVPILAVDQVERGQTGYGLSVFQGTEPERFEVEVIGVVRNDNPGSSFILARLSGGPADQPVEETGVIRGMSGSPVFIEDKLIGAVAFSWAFVEGAIAGITPIEEMRHLQTLPRPDTALAATGPPPVPLDRLLAGDLPSDLLERQLAAMAPPSPMGQAASVQWAAAGFGESTLRLLERTLAAPTGGGVAPMGTAPGFLPLGTASTRGSSTGSADGTGSEMGDEPPDPQPGDAVALVLIDGDFKLGPAGTITDRTGDSLVAFGHPFLNAGPVRIPMAEAEVVTVVNSQSNSFKVTNVGRHIGAIEQDRDPGVEGRLGVEAPMIPMTIRVHPSEDGSGGREQGTEFRVRVAAIPRLASGLMALATYNSLEVTRYIGGYQGLDVGLRFRMAEHGELYSSQSFEGPTVAGDLVSFLQSIAGYLLQNDFEKVEIEEVEVDLIQHSKPRTLTLVGAHAERSVVTPGQPLTLHLDLLPYRGIRFRRSVQVEIPADVPDGRYFFFVGDGASVDAARLALEPAVPINLRQALRMIRSLHSRKQLGVLGFFAGQGLSVAGEVMPQLPGSMASIWGAAPSGAAQPLRLVVAQEIFEPSERPLDGLVRIDLEVRRREPLSPDSNGEPMDDGESGESGEMDATGEADGAQNGDDGGTAEDQGGSQ